MRLVLL
ncbi:Protein of unknown function [Bacillus mobilis]|nr:Protein of unknown function [Bacillus mobilis]